MIIDLLTSIMVMIGVGFINCYLPISLAFWNRRKASYYAPLQLPSQSTRVASFITGSKQLNNMLDKSSTLKGHPLIVQMSTWLHPSISQEKRKEIEKDFNHHVLFFGRLACLLISPVSLITIIFLYFLSVLSYKIIGLFALLHCFLGIPCWYFWTQSKQNLNIIELNHRGPYLWVKSNLLSLSMAQIIDVYDCVNDPQLYDQAIFYSTSFDNHSTKQHHSKLNLDADLNSSISAPPSAMV